MTMTNSQVALLAATYHAHNWRDADQLSLVKKYKKWLDDIDKESYDKDRAKASFYMNPGPKLEPDD